MRAAHYSWYPFPPRFHPCTPHAHLSGERHLGRLHGRCCHRLDAWSGRSVLVAQGLQGSKRWGRTREFQRCSAAWGRAWAITQTKRQVGGGGVKVLMGLQWWTHRLVRQAQPRRRPGCRQLDRMVFLRLLCLGWARPEMVVDEMRSGELASRVATGGGRA